MNQRPSLSVGVLAGLVSFQSLGIIFSWSPASVFLPALPLILQEHIRRPFSEKRYVADNFFLSVHFAKYLCSSVVLRTLDSKSEVSALACAHFLMF